MKDIAYAIIVSVFFFFIFCVIVKADYIKFHDTTSIGGNFTNCYSGSSSDMIILSELQNLSSVSQIKNITVGFANNDYTAGGHPQPTVRFMVYTTNSSNFVTAVVFNQTFVVSGTGFPPFQNFTFNVNLNVNPSYKYWFGILSKGCGGFVGYASWFDTGNGYGYYLNNSASITYTDLVGLNITPNGCVNTNNCQEGKKWKATSYGLPIQCRNITDTFVLDKDVYADTEPCFWISSSNVDFDLNGYTIYKNVSSIPLSRTAIYVMPNNSTPLNNVTIRNGEITDFNLGFASIDVGYTNNLTLVNLDIHDNNEIGIRITHGYDNNITNNNIYDNQYGLELQDVSNNYLIQNNYFNNVNKDLDISNGILTNSFVMTNRFGLTNVFGQSCCSNQTIWIFPYGNIQTTTCVMPCGVWYSNAQVSIDCYNCNSNDFVGNYHQANVNFRSSNSNRFVRETFAHLPNNTYGLTLDGNCNNNWGCGCEGYVFDNGNNDSFVTSCPVYLYPNETTGTCSVGWKCVNSNTVGYRLPDCSYTNIQGCNLNKICVDGECVASSPTSNQNATVFTPFTNFGSVSPVLTIVDFIFTPFFLLTMAMIGVSAMVSNYIGGDNSKGTIFMVICLLFMILYTVSGIYPAWIGVTLIVLVSFVLAKTFGIIGKSD